MILLFVFFMVFSDCINKDGVFLREKPNSKAKVLWQVRKYFPFMLVKNKDNWVNVKDYRGDKYWVEAVDLSSDYKCLIVKTKGQSIRSGPGLDFSVKYKEPASEFDCFKVRERKDSWILAEDPYGDTGWFLDDDVWVY